MRTFLAVLLLGTAVVCASEEEFLPWQEVRIVSAERPETGKVELMAVADTNGHRQVEIVAFGKKHTVPAADLAKLRRFPLDSLRLTHEAGYEELGGHTVHLRLKRENCIPGGYVEETVVISVSRGKGLAISEPRQREFSKFPQHAWETVLRAMQAGDKEALALACTAKGYQSIVKGQRTHEATPNDLKAWGKSWSGQAFRFTSETAETATASFGNEVKSHGLSFLKTADGWKLDLWAPGK
jgi:hypothetical protein